jgi:hypothetical protein
VFQVHGADKSGKALFRRKLRRSEVARFFAELEPCLVGMEASGSAHNWARVLTGAGHTVQLMAPQFVKPYVKSNKNDANDTEAICEAVTRPGNIEKCYLGNMQCIYRLYPEGFWPPSSRRTADSGQLACPTKHCAGDQIAHAASDNRSWAADRPGPDPGAMSTGRRMPPQPFLNLRIHRSKGP